MLLKSGTFIVTFSYIDKKNLNFTTIGTYLAPYKIIQENTFFMQFHYKYLFICFIFNSFLLLLNILSRRKQKMTLDGLNNNIEVGYSSLANISKLTELEENKFRQLKREISESSEKIKKLGKLD